jgi:mono/diheme cytochrome c family protein
MPSYKISAIALSLVALLGFAAPRFVLAADDGERAFAETCSSCHTAKIRPLDKKRMTQDQWKQAIAKMADLGAEIPKDKVPQILDYLARTHGPDSK